MKLNLLFLPVFFLSSLFIHAQDIEQQLINNEDELVNLYNQLLLTQENDVRDSINNAFYELLAASLELKGAFNYTFDKLPTISKMQSEDKVLRVFTWNIQNNEGIHAFYGMVQLSPKVTKNKEVKCIRLSNQKGMLENTEMKSYGADKWPGAVYYQIIMFKKGKQKYYTLAGWRGIDDGLTQKLIDVIYVSSENVKFGYPIFKMEKKMQRRIVFSYNAKSSMHLQFSDNQDAFIFDHLAPSSSLVAGQYRFYGPDGSYDMLKREKKYWLYVPNMDAKNQEKDSDLFYNPVTKPDVD